MSGRIFGSQSSISKWVDALTNTGDVMFFTDKKSEAQAGTTYDGGSGLYARLRLETVGGNDQ